MTPVRQFVEAFNTNDVEGMQAACAEPMLIIDDFPPHEWSGPGATASWYREMERMAPGEGMSDWSVELGGPRHMVVSGAQAYVAVPADVRWIQDATPSERGCMMTMSLRQTTEGWRISALAWAWS